MLERAAPEGTSPWGTRLAKQKRKPSGGGGRGTEGIRKEGTFCFPAKRHFHCTPLRKLNIMSEAKEE